MDAGRLLLPHAAGLLIRQSKSRGARHPVRCGGRSRCVASRRRRPRELLSGATRRRLQAKRRLKMKTLVSAIALLVGSNIMAVAGDQTLKFKLVTVYIGEKDGESHMAGVTVSPDGTIGTKDFYDKAGENGASTGHSTYYFPDGSLVANYSARKHGNPNRRPCCRQIPDHLRRRRLSGRDRRRINRWRLGRQEPAQGRRPLQHRIGHKDAGNLGRLDPQRPERSQSFRRCEAQFRRPTNFRQLPRGLRR